jgi:hypothetical protein
MRRAIACAAALVVALGMVAQAAALGPVALGFHLSPGIEKQDGRRTWDLSLSLGVTVELGVADSVEFTAIIDSGPTALGTTLAYNHDVSDHVTLGAGLTVLWPVAGDATLQTPLFESFARASYIGAVGDSLSAEAAASLPFLTVAKTTERWSLIPLAELPSVSVAGDVRLATRGSLKLQLTLQPVITDTTVLVDPYGRVTDDLLVLPMFSAFTRYVP